MAERHRRREREAHAQKEEGPFACAGARGGDVRLHGFVFIHGACMCAYDIPARPLGWGDEKQRGGRTETMPGIYMDFGSYTRFTLYAHPKAHTRGEEGERREKTGTGGLEESPHGAGPTQKRNKEPTGLIQPVCLSCRFCFLCFSVGRSWLLVHGVLSLS